MTRAALLATALAALAACDAGGVYSPPPDPLPPPPTRVVRLTLDPDTVVVGDTALFHVVIEDSLDTGFRYVWSSPEERLVPVDGRTDGPRVRWIAPRTSGGPGEVRSVGGTVGIISEVPRTRAVIYSYSIPVLTPAGKPAP